MCKRTQILTSWCLRCHLGCRLLGAWFFEAVSTPSIVFAAVKCQCSMLIFFVYRLKNQQIIFTFTVQWPNKFGIHFSVALLQLGSSFVQDLFEAWKAWKLGSGSAKRKLLWHAPFFVTIWAIQKERNKRCFEGKSPQLSRYLQIQISCCLLGVYSPEFLGVPIGIILLHWREVIA